MYFSILNFLNFWVEEAKKNLNLLRHPKWRDFVFLPYYFVQDKWFIPCLNSILKALKDNKNEPENWIQTRVVCCDTSIQKKIEERKKMFFITFYVNFEILNGKVVGWRSSWRPLTLLPLFFDIISKLFFTSTFPNFRKKT